MTCGRSRSLPFSGTTLCSSSSLIIALLSPWMNGVCRYLSIILLTLRYYFCWVLLLKVSCEIPFMMRIRYFWSSSWVRQLISLKHSRIRLRLIAYIYKSFVHLVQRLVSFSYLSIGIGWVSCSVIELIGLQSRLIDLSTVIYLHLVLLIWYVRLVQFISFKRFVHGISLTLIEPVWLHYLVTLSSGNNHSVLGSIEIRRGYWM